MVFKLIYCVLHNFVGNLVHRDRGGECSAAAAAAAAAQSDNTSYLLRVLTQGARGLTKGFRVINQRGLG